MRVSSGRSAGRRFDAENRVTTEALIFLGELDPEAVGPSIEYATHYEPTPMTDAERCLDLIPQPLEATTFLDVGSGMGRMVLLAARRPFRTIVGVEISPALHEVAKENLARTDRAGFACKDVRLVRADAAGYALPRGPLAVYLYNPFRAEVLAPLAERLATHAAGAFVVYHTPLARAVFDHDPRFTLAGDLGFAVGYRVAPREGHAVTATR
jgi:SAM-dependent methyltransferase